MSTRRTLSLLTFVMLFLPALAVAQTPEEVQRAQEHFQKGAESYAAGDYPKAVVEFMSGHQLAPNAMFLYNVSLSYERLGRIGDALEAAEKAREYDGMSPKVENRNEARITAFSVVLSSEDVAEDVGQAVADTGETGETSGEVTGPGDETEVETRPDGITGLGWTGVGLALVGGGFAVAGFAVNSSINGDIPAYEDAVRQNDTTRASELRGDISKRQQRGKIFYAIGAGAAGLGLTLFVVDLLTGTETVPVAAGIQPTNGGASVSARFQF